jgi:hypothetical protein
MNTSIQFGLIQITTNTNEIIRLARRIFFQTISDIPSSISIHAYVRMNQTPKLYPHITANNNNIISLMFEYRISVITSKEKNKNVNIRKAIRKLTIYLL